MNAIFIVFHSYSAEVDKSLSVGWRYSPIEQPIQKNKTKCNVLYVLKVQVHFADPET